jgi:hypothetical protein
MLIACFMPLVEFGIAWTIGFGDRFYDRGFSKNEYRSKQKSIALYIDTYSGPEYSIHFRYS